MTVNPMSIGYGPRARLLFDGDENQYDLWEVRFLGYLQLQGLKSVVLSTDDTIDADKNEKVFSEMVQVLDEKSLCLIMNDAADDGRAALKILRSHYKGSGKPRVLTLYTNLCNLQMGTMSLTEYVSKAERLSTNLKSCKETVSDSMLIAMVMRGLPESYSSFIVVITQSSKEYLFCKLCNIKGHTSENCRSKKKTVMTPASNHDRAKALKEDSEHEYAFRISDNRLNSGPCKKGRGDLPANKISFGERFNNVISRLQNVRF